MAETFVVIKSALASMKGMEIHDEDGREVGVVTDFRATHEGESGEIQARIHDPAMIDKIVNGSHQCITMGAQIYDSPQDSTPAVPESIGHTQPTSRKEKKR